MGVDRAAHRAALLKLLKRHRSVAILGARQVGKTTLARQIGQTHAGPVTFFDLENVRDLERLEQPLLALEGLRGLVILDEVQRRPELFPSLRVLIDQPRAPKFLILGSAAPDLLRQSSESLAGRIIYYPLDGFSLAEVGASNLNKLWLRGSLPRSFLSRSEKDSVTWRESFLRSFIEREIPQLGISIPPVTLRRFWSMLAHSHGQTWNASELARSFGVSDVTVRRYLDLLAGTFMLRLLPPWFENVGKRQVRAPKVYIADSGLLHTILGLDSRPALEAHPKLGASWEGFILHQVITRLGARSGECFFWRAHTGAELDLLIVRGLQRRGFEIKRTDVPKLTPSMRAAMADLRLDGLEVIHAGPHTFPLTREVRAVAASRLLTDIQPLR